MDNREAISLRRSLQYYFTSFYSAAAGQNALKNFSRVYFRTIIFLFDANRFPFLPSAVNLQIYIPLE